MHADQSDFRRSLETAIADLGVERLDEDATLKLVRHYSMMLEWNRRINLTRITDPDEAARFHYAESLYGLHLIGDAKTLLDIGSGAGFPAVPLAIARRDLNLTALESNRKKALFLREVKSALDLQNFSVAAERVEQFDWSRFELLTCRALDHCEEILPTIIERLRKPQRLMLYCGSALAARLAAIDIRSEDHPIPHSEQRLIVLYG